MEVQTKICKYRPELPMNVDLTHISVSQTPLLGNSAKLQEPPDRLNTTLSPQSTKDQKLSQLTSGSSVKKTWEWGVNTFTSVHIGKTKVKISLQDLALIMQITNFASE